MRSRFARLFVACFAGFVCSGATVAQVPQASPPPALTAASGGIEYSAEQRQWLAEHPVVRVLSDAASPPFDFLDEQGRHVGLYADYLDELSRATGLHFEWSEQTRRDKLVDAARGGQGELIVGFAVPVAAEKGFVAMRRAVAHDYPVLVVRRQSTGFDSTASERQRVSLVRGYAPAQDYAERMQARQFLNAEGFEPALVDVAVARTDMSVQSLAVAEYLIRQRGLLGLEIVGPYSRAGDGNDALSWWVPTAVAPLAGILEKAWDSLPPERHRTLRARWLDRPVVASSSEPPLHTLAHAGASGWLLAIAALLIILLLLIAFLVWRLRRRRHGGALGEGQHDKDMDRLLEQSPALIFEMEQSPARGVVLRYVSHEVRRLFAIEIDEDHLPVEAFLRTVFPDDQARVVEVIQKSAAERREMDVEYRVLTSQGLRWVKTIFRPRQQGGEDVVWSGVTLDISVQKRAELLAEQNAQRLREIADNVPGVVLQFQRDLAGTFMLNFASASLFAVRGTRPEDFNRGGEAFFSSVHDEDRTRLRELIEHSAASLDPLNAEYRVRMGDGHIEWMAISAVPSRARDGVVIWNAYISNVSRLKLAEEQMQVAQRFLYDLTDGVPGFIYQLRRDNESTAPRFIFVSAGVTTHGLSIAEAMANSAQIYDSVEVDDRERVIAALERSYASLSPLRVEYRVRLPTGLTAWMRSQAVPLRDANGAVTWNGMTFNISEEKLRELQARRAEERLNRLSNAMPGVVFQLASTSTGEWIYTYISDGVRAMHQLEPEAVLGDASLLHQMLFSEDWRRFEMALNESMQSGSEVLRECRMRRADGALRWISMLARPHGHNGDLFVWNGFSQDITAAKEAQAAAAKLQQHLVEVTENVPCTVFQLHRDFEGELSVRFVSENIYDLIGITRESLTQDFKALVSHIVADDLALTLDALDIAHREQRPVVYDFRIYDTSGGLRWLRGSVSTPRVEDGGMVWNGAWLDITDIKELEVELASASQVADGANRLKSEFLATMSHEIRTPMNAIIGLGELMQQTPLSSSQRGYLNKINTASQSLLGILNDILDHSKIEAGKMSLERTEFDLNTVLDNLCAVTHLKAIEKNLELRFEVPPGLPMRLLGDPLRLGQVLLNLTSNAIKFSELGTVVLRVSEVSRADGDMRLSFEVSDQGIGLSAEQIQGLFQSFAQGDASTTRKYGGTGLGLSISRNLIRLMGGDIEVQSQLGQGSVFRFEAVVGLSLEPQPRYDLPRDLFGLHALVVDDNVETRAATEQWLQVFGFVTSGAHDGIAALDLIQQRTVPFALAILDWRMPGLNGVETAERIRLLPLNMQPALLMATAYINDDLVRQCEHLGLKDFLAKPFSPSALFNTVLAALGRAEATATPGDLQPLTGLKVLVADDNEVNLEIASEILQSAGASIRIARNGEEVLERLDTSEFDVALLDLQMPKLDGLQAAQRLRADPRFATLPLVAMTAHAMPEHREASRLAGFDAHLLKPIDRRELFDTLLRYRPGAVADAQTAAAMQPSTPIAEAGSHGQLFNRAVALQRLGGNHALLDRLLARFASDHATAAQQIAAVLESGDTARATREAHTLKGVAANLGATLLAGSAAAVEEALRSNGTVTTLMLDLLRIHQHETLLAIQQSAQPLASAASRPSYSHANLRALLEQLQTLLRSHDANAKDAYEALQQALMGQSPPSLLRLRSAVENYEFDLASLALQEVFRDLNLVADENG